MLSMLNLIANDHHTFQFSNPTNLYIYIMMSSFPFFVLEKNIYHFIKKHRLNHVYCLQKLMCTHTAKSACNHVATQPSTRLQLHVSVQP